MGARVFWLPMIVVTLSLLGAGITSPTFARGSGGAHGIGIARSSARVSPIFRSGRIGTPGLVAGLRGVQNGVFRRGAAFRNTGLAGIWPYPWWPTDTMAYPWWPTDTMMPAEVGTAVPSEPQVIVISSPNYAQGHIATTPGDPPDYSYVAGCHAIPNGYHCDAPGQEAPAP
jgi:hypothetical protein